MDNKLLITEAKLAELVDSIKKDVEDGKIDTSSAEYIEYLKSFFELVNYKV